MARPAATRCDYERRLAAACRPARAGRTASRRALPRARTRGTLLSAAALARAARHERRDGRAHREGARVPRPGRAAPGVGGRGANPSPGERLRRTLDDVPHDELLAATTRRHLTALDALVHHVSSNQFDDAVAVLDGEHAGRVARHRPVCASRRVRSDADRTHRQAEPALVHVGTSFADELSTLDADDAVVCSRTDACKRTCACCSSAPRDSALPSS